MLFLYIMYQFIGKVEVEGYFQRRPVTHTSSAHVGTQNFKQNKNKNRGEIQVDGEGYTQIIHVF